MRPQLQMGLPSHITVDRFQRVVMTAINNNHDLASADRRSLFNAAIKAAQDGLLPDGREGALVIFKEKTSGKKLVQWIPMVYGLIKLVRQSGEIDRIGARIVYQKELDEQSPARPHRKRFEYVFDMGGDNIYHDPILWGDRGPPVLVYAYAHFKDGGAVEYEILHKIDIDKRRAVSKAGAKPDAPWQAWLEEMWKKTAIRAICKKLPLSADILARVEKTDEPTEFDRLRAEAMKQLSGEPEPMGELTFVEGPGALLEKAETGFLNATTVEELEDFSGLILDEAAELDLPDADKLAVVKQLKAMHENRAKDLEA